MSFTKKFLLFTLLISSFQLKAQNIIWAEDFSSYSDGTTTGLNLNTTNSSADWTSSGCTTCPASSTDYWEVRSGAMVARDVNDENVIWLSESIDISAIPTVVLQVQVSETGDHEGLYLGTDDCADVVNQDYADVLYSIDGGPFTLIVNSEGWCGLYASCATHTLYGDDGAAAGDCRTTDADWGSTIVVRGGLSGSTLQIMLQATNSSGTEFIRFDDIVVTESFALPVELSSFNVKKSNSLVELNWTTHSELNNDYFEIQRSKTGKIFETIGFQKGAGTSNEIINYKFADLVPMEGITYYRLEQFDFDGKSSFSPIRTINETRNLNKALISPQPAKDQLTISYQTESNNWTACLINSQGIKLVGRNVKGSSNLTIDVSGFSSGVYVLVLRDVLGIEQREKVIIN